jgi:uncharacterized membrane protein YhaH (DUF805 family)
MPATILWFLFDWRGRLSARSYRFSILALGVTVAGLEVIPFRSPYVIGGLVAAQILIQAALDAKRLHDIGQSAALVLISSAVCVGGAAYLYNFMPETGQFLTQKMTDSIGPLAKIPELCVAFAGLGAAAAMRSSMLACKSSTEAGEKYAFNPIARRLEAVSIESEKSRLDADAVIARALEDKRLQEVAAAMRQASVDSRISAPRAVAPQSARKSFGRRSA